MARRYQPPFEVEIEDLGPKGVGLGVAPDGRSVSVVGAAPGTRVFARVTGRKGAGWQARRVSTVRPAPDGEVPRCAVFGRCGGCAFQELPIAAQRAAREAMAVREVAEGLGLTAAALREQVTVRPIRAGSEPWGYRNKVELSFGAMRYVTDEELEAGAPREGRFLGFHAPGRFDRVVDAARCELVDDGANALIAIARAHALDPDGPPPWDTRAHHGFWRHLVLRQGRRTGERVVVLVTASPEGFPGAEARVEALARALRASSADGSRVVGVSWQVHDGVAEVARGVERAVYGVARWTERLGGRTLSLGPDAFFQASTEGAEALYTAVAEALGGGGDVLYDLYCGVGSIGLFLADRYARVVGLEEVAGAIDEARANAAANGVVGTWTAVRVEDALDAVVGGAGSHVVVDPPRAGLHPKVARKLAETRAGALVYVACNPASLGRDAALLAPGWRLVELVPVDLFPHTRHVEVVGRFEPVAAP